MHTVAVNCSRQEILAVLGTTRATVVDMTRLPYTQERQLNQMMNAILCLYFKHILQAMIAEVQRMSCVAPGSIPHLTTRQMKVGEFTIPARSSVR